MSVDELTIELPEALILDFASDPLAPFNELPLKAGDSSWHLHSELAKCLAGIPAEALESAYSDSSFSGLYGKNERLARIWIAERALIKEAARRRLDILAGTSPIRAMPYAAECLRDVNVSDEGMVRLADFAYNNANLSRNGNSFIVASTTESPNSTYWLLQSFYEQRIADHVSARLDPFLWGPSATFPQMMYKMIVYAKPVNWDGISTLKETHHGQMRADDPLSNGELTEFVWEPRSDGIHFLCEELPSFGSVDYRAARYLHAIYDHDSQSIIHFDGALRIYTEAQLHERRNQHLRNAGKAGIRTKIFRIDQPIGRNTFSLIAQAFFVWNRDVVTYFTETLAI